MAHIEMKGISADVASIIGSFLVPELSYILSGYENPREEDKKKLRDAAMWAIKAARPISYEESLFIGSKQWDHDEMIVPASKGYYQTTKRAWTRSGCPKESEYLLREAANKSGDLDNIRDLEKVLGVEIVPSDRMLEEAACGNGDAIFKWAFEQLKPLNRSHLFDIAILAGNDKVVRYLLGTGSVVISGGLLLKSVGIKDVELFGTIMKLIQPFDHQYWMRLLRAAAEKGSLEVFDYLTEEVKLFSKTIRHYISHAKENRPVLERLISEIKDVSIEYAALASDEQLRRFAKRPLPPIAMINLLKRRGNYMAFLPLMKKGGMIEVLRGVELGKSNVWHYVNTIVPLIKSDAKRMKEVFGIVFKKARLVRILLENKYVPTNNNIKTAIMDRNIKVLKLFMDPMLSGPVDLSNPSLWKNMGFNTLEILAYENIIPPESVVIRETYDSESIGYIFNLAYDSMDYNALINYVERLLNLVRASHPLKSNPSEYKKLIRAVEEGDVKGVETAIKNGAEVRTNDSRALQLAASSLNKARSEDSISIMRLLHTAGANIKANNNHVLKTIIKADKLEALAFVRGRMDMPPEIIRFAIQEDRPKMLEFILDESEFTEDDLRDARPYAVGKPKMMAILDRHME